MRLRQSRTSYTGLQMNAPYFSAEHESATDSSRADAKCPEGSRSTCVRSQRSRSQILTSRVPSPLASSLSVEASRCSLPVAPFWHGAGTIWGGTSDPRGICKVAREEMECGWASVAVRRWPERAQGARAPVERRASGHAQGVGFAGARR